MNCPVCGSPVPEFAERCQACGSAIDRQLQAAYPGPHDGASPGGKGKLLAIIVIAILVIAGVSGFVALLYLNNPTRTASVAVTIDNWGWNELNYTLYFDDELMESDSIDGFTTLTQTYEVKWRGDDAKSVYVKLDYGDTGQSRSETLLLLDGSARGVTFHISDIYPT